MEEKSTRKKLAFVITKSNWGGAQRYVFDLAIAAKERYAVSVIVGGDGPLAEKLRAAGIPVVTIAELGRDVNPIKDLASGWKLFRAFRKLKPDIVHLNSSKIGGLGSLAARMAFVPRIVFTAHGWAFNEDRSLFQKTLIRSIAWLTMLWSNETIAVSSAIRKQASSFPFIRKKIAMIHLGVSPVSYFEKDEARTKLAGSIPPGCTLIGSVGELHPIKGHIYAIQAIADLVSKGRDVKYIICGEGAYRPVLEQKIAELKMQERIVLAGNVPEAARYLKAFDIFLFPSLSEALGYAALEAGMAEIPVVASAVGGVPEIIDNMKSGILIHSRKPGEIVAAIELLLDKPELKERYAAALHEKVLRDFSMEKMIAETERVYKSIKY